MECFDVRKEIWNRWVPKRGQSQVLQGELLRQIPEVHSLQQDADGLLHVESGRDIRREVTAMLVKNGYTLLQMRQRGGDLDEIYQRYFEKAGEQHDTAGGKGTAPAVRRVFPWRSGRK